MLGRIGRRFQQFRDASGLVDPSQSKQINTLLYCMGESAEDVLTSMHPTEDEKGDYGVVMDKFDSFRVRKNVLFERARFNNWVELPKETVEQFITELYHLVESCDYPEGLEEAIRDKLVVGIRDGKLSVSTWMLLLLWKLPRKRYISRRQLWSSGGCLVSAVRSYCRGRGEPLIWRQAHCTRCGQEALLKALCLAKETSCHFCQKRGHCRHNASEQGCGVSKVTSDDLPATETSQRASA